MGARILYSCQSWAGYGGVQRLMLDIVRHLDKSRFAPLALCAPEGEMPNFLSQAQARVGTVGEGKYWRYSFNEPLATLRDLQTVAGEIIRLARTQDVRIVHTFDGMVFFAACLAKLQCKDLKVIWVDSGFDNYRYHFRMVMRWCFKYASLVAAVTDIRRRQLLAEGLDPAKSAVMPNGTDFHLLSQTNGYSEPHVSGEPVHIGIVGRLVPVKNFELFLRAARLVADAYPQVRFSIVGNKGLFPDEVEYYQRIRQLATSLDLDD
jgi:glycosyltransferase involved in cell wall biosynthesis